MHDCAESQQMSEMLKYYTAKVFSTNISAVFPKYIVFFWNHRIELAMSVHFWNIYPPDTVL